MINENINIFISSIHSVDDVVLCVGPGVSISSGLPSMNELIKKTINYLGANDAVLQKELLNIDYLKLPLVMEFLKQEYGSTKVTNVIRKIYDTTSIKSSEILDSVARFPARAYITSNFDELLETRLHHFNKDFEVYVNDTIGDILHKTTIPVIKLNGSIHVKSGDIRFSKKEKFNFAFSSLLNSQIISIMQTNIVLFVGFSLKDLEEFYELYKINNKFEWFFISVGNRNNLEEKIWRNRGIKILNLEDNFEIPKFLDSLTTLIKSKHKKNLRKKNNKIYISSSYEDEYITSQIRRGLIKSNFDVISAGETYSLGLTILESIDKILDDVGTAIIILPDKNEITGFENFIFELGYITAKLGRSNVIVVIPETLNRFPSNLSGSLCFTYHKNDNINIRRIVDLITIKHDN